MCRTYDIYIQQTLNNWTIMLFVNYHHVYSQFSFFLSLLIQSVGINWQDQPHLQIIKENLWTVIIINMWKEKHWNIVD